MLYESGIIIDITACSMSKLDNDSIDESTPKQPQPDNRRKAIRAIVGAIGVGSAMLLGSQMIERERESTSETEHWEEIARLVEEGRRETERNSMTVTLYPNEPLPPGKELPSFPERNYANDLNRMIAGNENFSNGVVATLNIHLCPSGTGGEADIVYSGSLSFTAPGQERTEVQIHSIGSVDSNGLTIPKKVLDDPFWKEQLGHIATLSTQAPTLSACEELLQQCEQGKKSPSTESASRRHLIAMIIRGIIPDSPSFIEQTSASK